MYESPITVNVMDEMRKHFIEHTEDGIVARVREVMHIDIDKDELLKALKYDRYQYEHGYANGRMDGHASGYKERDDEIVRCGNCLLFKSHRNDTSGNCIKYVEARFQWDFCSRAVKSPVEVVK